MMNNYSDIKARKILCIGGSTYNPCTPCKIRDALANTQFLDEWTVIFANHLYFRVCDLNYDVKTYKFKILGEWNHRDIGFIEKQNDDPLRDCLIEKGRVYILPDPWGYTGSGLNEINSQFDWIYGKFVIKEDLPIIEFSSYKEVDEWYLINLLDALKKERDYLPAIDKIMIELANSSDYLEKIAGLIICGKDGDGAYGLQAIKKAGGHTAVQIPDECNCPSMPYTALKLEPNHRQVCFADSYCEFSLTKWLMDIK